MGLVVDPDGLETGVFAEGSHIRDAIQELGHLLLEGIGAGNQMHSEF
jgi:hypothetical protein